MGGGNSWTYVYIKMKYEIDSILSYYIYLKYTYCYCYVFSFCIMYIRISISHLIIYTSHTVVKPHQNELLTRIFGALRPIGSSSHPSASPRSPCPAPRKARRRSRARVLALRDKPPSISCQEMKLLGLKLEGFSLLRPIKSYKIL